LFIFKTFNLYLIASTLPKPHKPTHPNQSFAKELASQRTMKRQDNCHPENKKLKKKIITK